MLNTISISTTAVCSSIFRQATRRCVCRESTRLIPKDISRCLLNCGGKEDHDGQWVEVNSRVGSIKVKVLVTSRVTGKEVYLPLTSQSGPVNVLVGDAVDRGDQYARL